MKHVAYYYWLAVFCFACTSNDEAVDRQAVRINLSLPSNFPEPVYDLNVNPLTEEGVALGKMLFYDPQLSRNNSISCGFCHIQPAGFTHHGHDLSHGIDDKLGRRNSLPVQNLIWYKTFFWDGGVHNLDLVPLNAIDNPVEMDEEPEQILTKLQAQDKYKAQFKAAFGTEEITSTRFLQALSQFMATMISANSKYDKYVRHEGIELTEEELEGRELFKQKCASCHATDLFTDQAFRNKGFSTASDQLQDQGREEITLNPEDRGKFKVPSLRNVEYTAPYMHNGKLNSLKQVLDFYACGVQVSPTLDPIMIANTPAGIPLNEDEKKKIIAFLTTLTDEQFLSDRKFAEY